MKYHREWSKKLGRKFKDEIESIDEAKELFYGLAEERKQEKREKREAEKEAKRLAKEEAKEEARRLKEEAKNGKSSDTEDSDKISSDDKSLKSDDTAEVKSSGDNSEAKDSDVTEAEAEGSEDEKGKSKRRYRGRKKKKEKVNIVKELYYLAIYIGAVIIVCFLIITFIGERTTVKGDSMLPTLENGDNLWIDKISYRFTDPKRFDIIIFPPRNNSEKIYIKRIIGLPGETVQIDEQGNILIDGKVLVEDYGLEPIDPDKRGIAASPITLGKSEYFVLGDNRNNSEDSRRSIVGNVRKSEIIGKAVFRLSPLSKFGKIK